MPRSTSARLLVPLVCVCIASGAIWWMHRAQLGTAPQPLTTQLVSTPAPALTPFPTPAPAPSATPAHSFAEPTAAAATPPSDRSSPVPFAINSQRSQVDIELDAVQGAIGKYRTEMTINPDGTNAEITAALMGKNLKQVKLPVPDGSSVNKDGEMCDRWGTPYFFHALSHDHMQIRSAGPDRKMWTDDDIELQ